MDNIFEINENIDQADVNKDAQEHECGDDCDCNDIVLEMEDGTQKAYTIVDVIEHNEKQYIALAEKESQYYDILRMEKSGEEYQLTEIDNDDEYKEVAGIFEELLSAEDAEEEEE